MTRQTRAIARPIHAAAGNPRTVPASSHSRTAAEYGDCGLADRAGLQHVGHQLAQRPARFEGLVDRALLGVVADIAEQLDGQVELLTIHGVGAVGKVVGQPAEHVDVLVGDLDRQRSVGRGGTDVVVGAQVGQVVVVLVGEVAGQRPLGAEHADPSVAAQEDRAIVQVAAQRVERARTRHDPDRVDTHLQPEVLVAAQHGGVAGRALLRLVFRPRLRSASSSSLVVRRPRRRLRSRRRRPRCRRRPRLRCSSSSGSSRSSASSSAAFADAAVVDLGSADDVVDRGLSTSSQLRPMTSAIEFQRLAPALPVKWSIPPDTVPRLGLPLKNFDTAGSSHTDPMDDTIASAPASAVTDSSVGFSDTSSSTTTRSNCLSSAGSRIVRVGRGQVLPRRVVDQVVVGCRSARTRPDRQRSSNAIQVVVAGPGTPPTRRRRRASGVPTRCSGHHRTGSDGWAQGQQPCGTE